MLWTAIQFFGVWAQLGGFSNVSAISHLGGAVAGMAFWFLTRERNQTIDPKK